jgi:archaetidylinositol phosphate synthase
MVILRLRQRADAIHELERLEEARELERTLERVVHLCPTFGGHEFSIYDRRHVTVSTEDVSGTTAASAESRRAGRELVLEIVFRPLSNLLVPVLARIGVAPTAVVLANAVTGLGAAFALARGELLAAALLLLVKTLLDNADGQLARVTGRVTLTGRYLDTEADLVVNTAVFAALGHITGNSVLAAVALVALTLVLAVDFNLTELYREQRGLASPPPAPSGGRVERVLRSIYAVSFAQLDRLVRASSEHRFARLLAAEASAERSREARLAYVDGFTVTVLSNLGLTTQLLVLGVCLALGVPEAYLWLAVAGLLALVPLQIRAERRARAAF